MYDSIRETATGDVEVIAVFDDDDESASRYPEGPTYVTVPRGRNQSDLWNVAWEHASGEIAHMGADDLVYRTRGWDARVEKAFRRWRDRIGMVYVNDLYGLRDKPYLGQRPSETVDGKFVFAANPFVTREWIDAAGFFTPPYYKSWEADTWIYLLAESISRGAYLHDVVVEHLHPMVGKAEMDETYERGAWGNKRLRMIGWRTTSSRKMREVRAGQTRALTDAIGATRR